MNHENILTLAAHLEKLPSQEFDMSNWGLERDCGFVGCLAGHACILFRNKLPATGPGIRTRAETLLGLTPETSLELFVPSPSSGGMQASPSEAARVLRHLAGTGIVDWSIIGD